MPMLGAIIVPHPPLIIPTVGQGREREVQITIDTSPHAAMYADYFHISPGAGVSGSMASFGAPQIRLDAAYDAGLRQELVRQAEAAGIRAGTLG